MTEAELIELVRKAYSDANSDYIIDNLSKACEFCPENPKNGGKGVCFCTLGSPVVY